MAELNIFSGGLNTRKDPQYIDPSESVICENVDTTSGILTPITGHKRITSVYSRFPYFWPEGTPRNSNVEAHYEEYDRKLFRSVYNVERSLFYTKQNEVTWRQVGIENPSGEITVDTTSWTYSITETYDPLFSFDPNQVCDFLIYDTVNHLFYNKNYVVTGQSGSKTALAFELPIDGNEYTIFLKIQGKYYSVGSGTDAPITLGGGGEVIPNYAEFSIPFNGREFDISEAPDLTDIAFPQYGDYGSLPGHVLVTKNSQNRPMAVWVNHKLGYKEFVVCYSYLDDNLSKIYRTTPFVFHELHLGEDPSDTFSACYSLDSGVRISCEDCKAWSSGGTNGGSLKHQHNGELADRFIEYVTYYGGERIKSSYGVTTRLYPPSVTSPTKVKIAIGLPYYNNGHTEGNVLRFLSFDVDARTISVENPNSYGDPKDYIYFSVDYLGNCESNPPDAYAFFEGPAFLEGSLLFTLTQDKQLIYGITDDGKCDIGHANPGNKYHLLDCSFIEGNTGQMTYVRGTGVTGTIYLFTEVIDAGSVYVYAYSIPVDDITTPLITASAPTYLNRIAGNFYFAHSGISGLNSNYPAYLGYSQIDTSIYFAAHTGIYFFDISANSFGKIEGTKGGLDSSNYNSPSSLFSALSGCWTVDSTLYQVAPYRKYISSESYDHTRPYASLKVLAWDLTPPELGGSSLVVGDIIGDETAYFLNGTYSYAVSYVDNTGLESGLAAFTDTVEVDHSFVTLHFDTSIINNVPSGGKMRLYRIGGSIPTYKLVEEFTSVPPSYNDNNGDSVIASNPLPENPASDVPPSYAKFITEHKGRLFVAGSSGPDETTCTRLYFNEYGKFHSWPADNYIQFSKEIVGLVSLPSGLVVFHTNEVKILLGIDNTDYQVRTVSTYDGARTFRSIASSGELAYFVSYNGICATDGSRVSRLSYNKLGNYDFGNILYAEYFDERYIVGGDAFATIADFRGQSLVFTKISTLQVEWTFVDKGKLYFTKESKFYEAFGATTKLPLVYKSGDLTEGAVANLKQYDKIRVKHNGNGSFVLFFDDVPVLTEKLQGKKTTTIGIPNINNSAYKISFSVTGVIDIYSIEYAVIGRRNQP